MATFTKDIEEIRQRAEQKIEDGAVTDTYKLDKDRSVEILNEALATEIVCVLRYQHHYFMATGVHGKGVAQVFKEHADEEREHSDEIAERIQQLGGKPNFNPGDLVARSVSQYIEGESLADMIREDLIAERMVIDVYQRMIEYFGTKDPTTRTLLEHIKAEEEEHASELSDFLFIVNPQTGEEAGEDPGTDPLHLSDDGAKNKNGNKKNGASPRRQMGTMAELRDTEEDDTVEEELTAGGWGNEANIGQRGKGSPNRKTLAPPQAGWGNEANIGNGKTPKAGSGKAVKTEGRSDNSRGAQGKRGEARPTRDSGSAKRGDDELTRLEEEKAPAPNIPGTGGRTMNRRRNAEEIDTTEVAKKANRGASSGTNRSPRLIQKNRKGKRAA